MTPWVASHLFPNMVLSSSIKNSQSLMAFNKDIVHVIVFVPLMPCVIVFAFACSLYAPRIHSSAKILLAAHYFLSDPSPIIGYACHSLPNSLTHSLTHCCLVNLIDVTLVCEDANSKLVEVCYCCWCLRWGSCWQQLLQIWELRFGASAYKADC